MNFDWQDLPRHLVLDTRREIGRVLGRLEVSSPRRVLWFGVSVGAAALAYELLRRHSGLGEEPCRAGFMLVLSALLWVTEATPAYAVGILVIGLQVLLLGEPRASGGDWESHLAVLGHPLIWLFFGGFVLSAGTARTALDRVLAVFALARFGRRPGSLLAGVMCVTFGFSLFMSNTATTALMLALLAPVVAQLSPTDPYRKALLLGTALSANVGGMGSLIGTPPNAIAAGALQHVEGQSVGFLKWLLIGLPPATLLSILGWFYLQGRYPAQLAVLDVGQLLRSKPKSGPAPAPAWRRVLVVVVGLTTVVLWMTGSFHRAPTAVVSLLPVVAFTTAGVLGVDDMRSLPWDVLLLLAGGLALGASVEETGLARWLVSLLPLDSLGILGLALALAYFTAILSNLMSNTATAGVLIPVAIGMAPGAEGQLALTLALSASTAMCLPIATPPGALVFATGQVEAREFVAPGLLLGIVGPLLCLVWVRFLLGSG